MTATKKITTYPPLNQSINSSGDYQDFALLAVKHGNSLGMGRAARFNLPTNFDYSKKIFEQITTGTPDDEALYILNEITYEQLANELNSELQCGNVNGYIACLAKLHKISFKTPISAKYN